VSNMESGKVDQIDEGLLKSISEEIIARDLYYKRGKEAGALEDKKTTDLYAHVAGEEEEHHQEFKARLKERVEGAKMTDAEIEEIANRVASQVLEELAPAVLSPGEGDLLMHFTEHTMTGHALVVDEARAKASPCRCFKYKGRDYCFTHGAIGMLTPEQESEFCGAGKSYNVGAGAKQRFEKFAEAAEEAHKEIEGIPKGERLEPWLRSMGRELSKRGLVP
jgi:hypothetical protein